MFTSPIASHVRQAGFPISLAYFPLLLPPRKQAPLVLPPVSTVTISSSGGLRMATDAAIPKKSPIALSIPPFTSANNLLPIPDKLVCCIQAHAMKDLLLDNIALGKRMKAFPSRTAHPLRHATLACCTPGCQPILCMWPLWQRYTCTG